MIANRERQLIEKTISKYLKEAEKSGREMVEKLDNEIEKEFSVLKDSTNDLIKITFETNREFATNILRILKYCELCGKQGHTFEIEIDPDGDDSFYVGFDGDGSDQLKILEVEKN